MDADLTVSIPDDENYVFPVVTRARSAKRKTSNPLPGSSGLAPYEHPVIFEEITECEDARDLQSWETAILAEAYAQRQSEAMVDTIVKVLTSDEEIRAEVKMDRLNDPTEYNDKAFEIEDEEVPHFGLDD